MGGKSSSTLALYVHLEAAVPQMHFGPTEAASMLENDKGIGQDVWAGHERHPCG